MSEQSNSLLFDLARQRGLVLLPQLRLESPVAIAWSGEFETDGRRLNGLFANAVFTVCIHISNEMRVKFSGQSSFC
ncbi:hypothetical protein LF590_003003 [Salmonella enterica subsp. enterica serovar Napoli]|nr:hypothetical protein [Salmonella enterica subsp. enterica serovar Napoli]